MEKELKMSKISQGNMKATMCVCCLCQQELHLVWAGVFHYQHLKEYEELEKIESRTVLGALQHC